MTDRRHEQFEERRRRRERIAQTPRPLWLRTVNWILRISVISLVGLGVFAYYAYQSAQTMPDFYRQSLALAPQQLAESGAVFENRVLELQHSAQVEGDWQTIFTEDQVNGWLAVDMPRKFPKWLPKSVSQPRVSIEPGELKFACRFESRKLSGIVVATADAFCTEKENEVGVRIRSVSSGIIPIPVKRIADAITKGLHETGVPASWTEIEGDPVALITLPRSVTDVSDEFSVLLTNVEIQEKQIVLTGKTVAR